MPRPLEASERKKRASMAPKVKQVPEIKAFKSLVKRIEGAKEKAGSNDDMKRNQLPQLFEHEGPLHELPRLTSYLLKRQTEAEFQRRRLLTFMDSNFSEARLHYQ